MSNTQDDSFREIQLSGKQLVFLFMAVTVILVGVFLTGLLVGRGVLMARGAPGNGAASAAIETEPPPPPASASQSTSSSPATAGEKLSYAERLGSSEPAKEQLKPDTAPPAEAPTPKAETTVAENPAPAPAPATKPTAPAPTPAPKLPPAQKTPATPAPAAPAAAAVSSSEPAGAGFAIQVAALREREEADTIVKRLAGKGYPAYVVTPAKGTPSVFRVRVGKFKERREADTVAARLQKEEQFKPWIVR
jgi:cell division septation protein DedD